VVRGTVLCTVATVATQLLLTTDLQTAVRTYYRLQYCCIAIHATATYTATQHRLQTTKLLNSTMYYVLGCTIYWGVVLTQVCIIILIGLYYNYPSIYYNTYWGKYNVVLLTQVCIIVLIGLNAITTYCREIINEL
jgi:hypothetical protein